MTKHKKLSAACTVALSAILALNVCSAASHDEDSAALPSLNIDLTNVTVSGQSSGGYMATQFHVAHSDWVKGSGALAAGPYYCAQGDITTALAQCVNKTQGSTSPEELAKKAKQYEQQGKIAALTNLKDAKVWLFHGTQDTRIIGDVSNKLHQQYLTWTDTQNVKYINDKPIAHVFPTKSNGTNCMQSESPFIGNCDYDAAGDMLNHLVNGLTPPDDTLEGKVHTIDQQAIAGESAKTLASEGFVFVPSSCAEGNECRVHISFHGCNQYADTVGDAYVTQTGINEWADDNNIVVVYPQTKKSLFMPLNPQGCWDWWGYASPDYANRDGAQIQAVTSIVKHLASTHVAQGHQNSAKTQEAAND